MFKFAFAFIIFTFSLKSYASPLSDALEKAKRLNSSYAVISFDQKVYGKGIKLLDANDNNYAIGFIREENLINSIGQVTSFEYGSGFVVNPDGTIVSIKSISGVEFKPLKINNTGTIVGIYVDPLSPTRKLTPVVSSVFGGFEKIEGLPNDYDEINIVDINQNGTILLNASYYTYPTIQDGLDYIDKTFLAKRSGPENRYIVTEVPLPLFDYSTLRPYLPIHPHPESTRSNFSVITGYISLFLTDDEIILGDTIKGGGFLYKPNEGMSYLYPGTGPVDYNNQITNSASIPISLSLPQSFLSLDGKLIGIQTKSELVNYEQYNVFLTNASSDGKVVGLLNSGKNDSPYLVNDRYPAIVIQNDGTLINLECALPNSMGVSKFFPNIINSNGLIYATAKYNSLYSSGQMILVRNPQIPINNYCVKVNYRYLGKCAKILGTKIFSIKNRSTCTLEVSLKDTWNNPVRNAKIKVETLNGKRIGSGTTNKFGVVKLIHRINHSGSRSFNIFAPYDNKNYRNKVDQFDIQTN